MIENIRKNSFLILAFILFAIAFAFLDKDYPSNHFPLVDRFYYKIGYIGTVSLLYSFLVYWILKSLVNRLTEYRGKWLFSYALVFLVFSFYKTSPILEKIAQARNAKDTMVQLAQSELAPYVLADTDSNKATGNNAAFLDFVKLATDDQEAELLNYLLVMDEANLDKTFSLEVMADYDQLSHYQNVMKECVSKTDESQNRLMAILEQTKKQARTIKFSDEKFKAGFIYGLEKGLQEKGNQLRAFYENRKELLLGYGKLLDFLTEIYEDYWVDEGKLIFLTDEDLTFFQESLERLGKLEEDEKHIINLLSTI